jgi:transketolase
MLAEKDSNLMLLTGDLGYGVFEEFEKKYPKQYLNVGVAEQNMMGVAAGLALEGKIIFTYSIGNFPTLRCLEQIRNDACYHELNINIIATGGGFSYGGLGMSHHATEDLAIMRALPGVTLIAPCTAREAELATIELSKCKGVGYLRIDKTKAELESDLEDFQIGKVRVLVQGVDYTIFVAGGIAEEAVKASKILEESDVSLKVVSVHTLKPLDTEYIQNEIENKEGIIVVEEGVLIGGLGSAICELCIDNGIRPNYIKRLGLDDHFSSIVGSQEYLRNIYNLDANTIVKEVLGFIENQR